MAQKPALVHTTTIVTGVAIWFGLAFLAGALGLTQMLRPPAPQLLIVGLAFLSFLVFTRVPPVRAWTEQVDMRLFLIPHLGRFVGMYFLVLYGRGELPYAFAVPGGWGDIVAASGAVGLLFWGPPTGLSLRRVYFVWNILGLLDIIFVVGTAARIGLNDFSQLNALLKLPLALLPTFLVPLIFATHFVLFLRLRQYQPAQVG
ncbi:MAG: hypothetical protein K1Y36_10250 [Blastocatellia bacterium]|nr:hypothetical protein [Blastocatellia bacterium]